GLGDGDDLLPGLDLMRGHVGELGETLGPLVFQGGRDDAQAGTDLAGADELLGAGDGDDGLAGTGVHGDQQAAPAEELIDGWFLVGEQGDSQHSRFSMPHRMAWSGSSPGSLPHRIPRSSSSPRSLPSG